MKRWGCFHLTATKDIKISYCSSSKTFTSPLQPWADGHSASGGHCEKGRMGLLTLRLSSCLRSQLQSVSLQKLLPFLVIEDLQLLLQWGLAHQWGTALWLEHWETSDNGKRRRWNGCCGWLYNRETGRGPAVLLLSNPVLNNRPVQLLLLILNEGRIVVSTR